MGFLYEERFITKADAEKLRGELAAHLGEIQTAFAQLDPADKALLDAMAAPVLRRISERDALVDQDLIGSEEEGAEQEEEDRKILPHLEALFPFVASADEERKWLYLTAFWEHCQRRQQIQ